LQRLLPKVRCVNQRTMAPRRERPEEGIGNVGGAMSQLTAELGMQATKDLAIELRNTKKMAIKNQLAIALTSWLMGAKKDKVWTEETAAEHWAADAKDAKSVRLLGCAYETGRGKERDDRAARRCFLKAAMMGDPTAMRYVAGCYLRGVGGDVNYDEAFRWYRKAVHAGDVKSQANLADMLDEGQGCDRDASEAQTYYRAYRKGVCLGD